ncbi:MAG: Dabb family protein [Paludibacteraceae bacterium]|nr:Dabb family protein [Paludibacteraceae bacterium]MEE3484160.1 Dabb family protein [Bacteroidales bacterium]
MVKHVILWQLKDELSDAQKKIVKEEIKAGLEGLSGRIPGLLDIKVNINGLETSNADVMLDSSFVDFASLKGYAVHPEHVAVANNAVRPNTKLRVCMDYEV